MKVLLIQNAPYIPAHGGANKANRLLVEGLAKRNHTCRVVASAGSSPDSDAYPQLLRELHTRNVHPIRSSASIVAFRYNQVEVQAVVHSSDLRSCVMHQIREFEPTWIFVSSEDPGQVLLEAAVATHPSRVVYLAHTMLQFPFGPGCFLPSPAKTALLRQAAGIITVSNYLKEYFRRWAGLDSVVIPFPVYESGPFPDLGCFDRGFVTIINPCAVKGISIYLELARRLPECQFAAVPTWGATEADRAALAQLPNVRLLLPADDIGEIFAHTRVLLMPSLWGEGFPLTSVEAMLHGIPVLASDSGGLPEAKLGVDYTLPVRSIEQYEEHFDQRGIPVPIIPDQDIGPWQEALGEVVSDRTLYERLSRASREAALTFVSQVGVAPFEDFLERLATSPQSHRRGEGHVSQTSDRLEHLNQLSPEKRALLALRLKSKNTRVAP